MSVVLQGSVRQGRLILDIDVVVGDEIVAISGVNGIGKTTFLRVLAGLLPLNAGILQVNGTVFDDVDSQIFVPAHLRNVGMVFQDNVLLPFLSALDNVAYPMMATGVGRQQAQQLAIDAMGQHGIGHLAQMKPTQLSGGQQQRVALVRSLISKPQLVLLDEPLSALDVDARREVRSWLRDQLKSLPGTKFIVTHDLVDIAELCDREIAFVQPQSLSNETQTTIVR
ncbi:MAG: ATP-binding cassette domain-containing protein [Actinobacteria bacterium]|nr:ATP-binding cassette domain-containing protein [Actinomycetota bacterium]